MATEQAILNHQLQGIMLHSDLMDMYHLIRWGKFCRIHKKQLFCEMMNHIRTKKCFIEKHGKIIDPGPTARIKLPDAPAEPMFLTVEQRDEIHLKLLKAWHAWETDTVALYEGQMVEDASIRIWKCLRDAAKCEVERIEKMLTQSGAWR